MDVDFPLPEERAAFLALLGKSQCTFHTYCTRQSITCLTTFSLFFHQYLLAMVFAYFRRAGLQTEEYRLFFFPALLLANQMQEEGGVPHHFYIYTWAFGQLMHMAQLLHLRTFLFSRMGFRAWVPLGDLQADHGTRPRPLGLETTEEDHHRLGAT
ncbi:hypothetical protein PRIEUP_LOCUS17260, partial [Pristimantis euphronides]